MGSGSGKPNLDGKEEGALAPGARPPCCGGDWCSWYGLLAI